MRHTKYPTSRCDQSYGILICKYYQIIRTNSYACCNILMSTTWILRQENLFSSRAREESLDTIKRQNSLLCRTVKVVTSLHGWLTIVPIKSILVWWKHLLIRRSTINIIIISKKHPYHGLRALDRLWCGDEVQNWYKSQLTICTESRLIIE